MPPPTKKRSRGILKMKTMSKATVRRQAAAHLVGSGAVGVGNFDVMKWKNESKRSSIGIVWSKVWVVWCILFAPNLFHCSIGCYCKRDNLTRNLLLSALLLLLSITQNGIFLPLPVSKMILHCILVIHHSDVGELLPHYLRTKWLL